VDEPRSLAEAHEPALAAGGWSEGTEGPEPVWRWLACHSLQPKRSLHLHTPPPRAAYGAARPPLHSLLRAACCERCVPYAQYIYAQLTRSACTLATYTCSLTRLLLTPKPVPLPNRCSEFLLTRVTFVCLPYGPAAAAYRFYFHRLHSPEKSGKAHPYP